MPYHVSKEEFGALVQAAVRDLPAPFSQYVEEVAIEVRERPTPGQLRAMDLGPGNLLLGLYRGRPRTHRSLEESGTFPDVIYVFQDNIEQVSHSRQGLIDQVRTTVLHEIGHHFGLSEKDLDDVGFG